MQKSEDRMVLEIATKNLTELIGQLKDELDSLDPFAVTGAQFRAACIEGIINFMQRELDKWR